MKVEEIYTETRSHPVCHYLIPLESVLSYPVPYQSGDPTYLRFLVYRRGLAPRGEPRPVYRPHARLSVEYPSGQLVEYTDLRFAENAPASPLSEKVGMYPHPAVAGLSLEKLLAARSALFEATETIMSLLARGAPAADERVAISGYRELFEILAEPGLMPYYRSLSPQFFAWLESNSGSASRGQGK